MRTQTLFVLAAVASSMAVNMMWSSTASAQGIGAFTAELGITPESMVIARFQPAAAATVLSRFQSAEPLRQTLASQRLLADAAGVQISRLAEALFVDSGNAQLAAQYQVAVDQLDSIREQFNQVRSQLFDLTMAGVPEQQAQRLITWRNGATQRVEPEFRVRVRTEEQWKAITRALRAEGRAARLGEDLDQRHAQLLTAVRSEPQVAEAALRLEANLQIMKALFAQFGN